MHLSQKKVAFHTLGCKLNFSETSTISRQLKEKGCMVVDFTSEADIYVINTCSVTENADKKCKKLVRQVLRQSPYAYIVIIGCYAQLKPKEISEIPGVDLVLGAKEKFNLAEHLHDLSKKGKGSFIASEINDVDFFIRGFSLGERTRSFLKVQDGCDYSCAFCTIPLARGKSRSDKAEHVITEAIKLGKSGVKEIVLTGVNTGDFGKMPGDEKHTTNFYSLIQDLDKVEEIERFRISSIEPNLLTDEIIDFVGTSNRFMPHFHVPLQSGSDAILKKMRRRYLTNLYASRIERIKRKMPHACIGVDVIVGFPGETHTHFLETYNFLNELDISYLHVFTYSERPNTDAIEMSGVVSMEERNIRSKQLRNLSKKKLKAFYDQFIGKEAVVLMEETSEGAYLYGHSDNYLKVGIPKSDAMAGETIQIEIEGFDNQANLIGRPVQNFVMQ